MQNNQQPKNSVVCILCNSCNTSFFYSELNLILRRCDDCKIVFVHPLPTDEDYVCNLEINYNSLANKYGGRLNEEKENKLDEDNQLMKLEKRILWNKKKSRIYQKDLKKIKKYLNDKNQEDIMLLDVGCGEGYFIKEAIKKGFKCEGIEPSKTHIPSKEFNFKIFNTFLQNFKTKNKYDVITLLDVLEHTKNPKKEIENIKRIIKLNGLLMIRVPNLNWLIIKEKIIRLICAFTKMDVLILNAQGIYAPHTHLYNFSEKSLRKFLENSGFRIVGIEIINASHSDSIFKSFFYDIYYSMITVLFRITKINLAISLNVFAKPNFNNENLSIKYKIRK